MLLVETDNTIVTMKMEEVVKVSPSCFTFSLSTQGSLQGVSLLLFSIFCILCSHTSDVHVLSNHVTQTSEALPGTTLYIYV